MYKINTKKYIWVTAVIVLFIFLHFTKIIAPIESLIVKAFNPVLSSLYSASSYLRITYNERSEREELTNKVKRLEVEVTDLIVESARLKSLEEENQVLREYLKFFKENESSFVIGNIIARQRINSGDFDQNIIINKGIDDGIKVGAAVVSRDTIIGKVVEASNNISEICLITNRNCKLAATIQNIEKTSGIISGELGLTIKMEFIPQNEEVNIGDTVITSGLEERIPRGLVMGRIKDINKESNKLWQSATIEPLVDLDDLIIVSVLVP